MGYRSDVAYTIRFSTATKDDNLETIEKSFKLFLAEAKVNTNTELCFRDQYLRIDEKGMALNFFCDSVKWYSDFEEVNCHEKLVSLARDWSEDCPYIGVIFCRIGEELEDNEYECDGNYDWDWININRTIDRDW